MNLAPGILPRMSELLPLHARDLFGDAPPLDALVSGKRAAGDTIAVVLPAVNEAATIGAICEVIDGLRAAGLVDDLLVMDGGSTDATASVARAHGARVEPVEAVGKGDALWRSLGHIDASIVVWLDADVRNFGAHFVTRLVAPLLLHADLMFVKGFYARPFEGAPDEGGRVTELTVRPLLAAFFPELTRIRQPLAGEYAARTDVVRTLPFRTGYGVEIAMLIDLLDEVGIDAIAQADLGERVHRNRPLRELAPMAHEIAHVILERARAWGRTPIVDPRDGERPPRDRVQRASQA